MYEGLSGSVSGRGKVEYKGNWGVKTMEVYYIYKHEDTKHWKSGGERGDRNIMEGWTHSRYIVHMHGNITIKSPHITSAC
jgi:hypothetical protein